MNTCSRVGFSCLVGLGIAPASAHAQAVSIEHKPVGCVAAEKFPRFEAAFIPRDGIATARIVFQSDQTAQWWSVAMTKEGPSYLGVLPKPKKSLKAFRYYVEVTNQALATSRTPDYTSSVVGSRSECGGKLMASGLVSAAVVLQGPAGAVASLPAGFASTGVVAGTSSAATTAAGSAAAAGGGGLSTGLIVAGVGVAAAGVAVAVVAKGDGGTSYSGPVDGQRTVTSATCLFTSALVGTATVRLDQTSGNVTGDFSTTTTKRFIGATGGATCQGEGPSGSPNGECKITGSASAFGCTDQLDTGGNNVRTIVFSGGLSGGVVSGTVTFAVNGVGYSGSTTIPVTLR